MTSATNTHRQRAREYLSAWAHPRSPRPPAPFGSSWEELAGRRILQVAAREGYDAVGWTPGEVQAYRYDIAHSVKGVTYDARSGVLRLQMVDRAQNPLGGVNAPRREIEHRLARNQDFYGLEPQMLRALLAKADRSTVAVGKLTRGELYKLGEATVPGSRAAGMARFYDEKLPAVFTRLVRGLGGTNAYVGSIVQDPALAPNSFVFWRGEFAGNPNLAPQKDVLNTYPVNLIDLPDEVRTRAGEAQPLFLERAEPGAEGAEADQTPPADVGRDGAVALRGRVREPGGPGVDAGLGAVGALAGEEEERLRVEAERASGREVGLGEEAARRVGMGLAGGAILGGARRMRGRGPAGLIDLDGAVPRGPGSAAAERVEPGRPGVSEYRKDQGLWGRDPQTGVWGVLARRPVKADTGERPWRDLTAGERAGAGGEGAPYSGFPEGSPQGRLSEAFRAARARMERRRGPALSVDERAVALAQDGRLQATVDDVMQGFDTPAFLAQAQAAAHDNALKGGKSEAEAQAVAAATTVWGDTGGPLSLVDMLRQFETGARQGGLEWYEDVAAPLIELATDGKGAVDGTLLEELLHAWGVGGHQMSPVRNMRIAAAAPAIRQHLQDSGRMATLLADWRAGNQKISSTAGSPSKRALDDVRALFTQQGGPLQAQHAAMFLNYWTDGVTKVGGGTKLSNYYANAQDALRAAVDWLSVPDRWEFRRLGLSDAASAALAQGTYGRMAAQVVMGLNADLGRALGVAPHQFQAAAWTGYNRWPISGKGLGEWASGAMDTVVQQTTKERLQLAQAVRAGRVTGMAPGTAASGSPTRDVEGAMQMDRVIYPTGAPERAFGTTPETKARMRDAVAVQGRAVVAPGAPVRTRGVAERLLSAAGLTRAGTRLGGIGVARTPGQPADSWTVPSLDEHGVPHHLDLLERPGGVDFSGHLPQEHEATTEALAALMARAAGAPRAYVVRPLFGQDAAGKPNNALVVSHGDLTALGKTAADLPTHVRGPGGAYYVVLDLAGGGARGVRALEAQLVKLGFDRDPATGNILGATFDVRPVAPDQADALVGAAPLARRPALERVRDGLRGAGPGRPSAAASLVGAGGDRGKGYRFGPDGRAYDLPGLAEAPGGRVTPGQRTHPADKEADFRRDQANAEALRRWREGGAVGPPPRPQRPAGEPGAAPGGADEVGPEEPGGSIVSLMARGKRKGKAVMGMNKERIRQALGKSMYNGDLGAVSVKEMLQNAVDTVRPYGANGTVLVDVDQPNRTIRLSDNGTGMSPSVAENEFLDIGGTFKETDDASGGFGLAKIAYFSQSELIDVETVWKDPRGRHLLTTIRGNGDDWVDEDTGLDIDTRVLSRAEIDARAQQYGRATGTNVTIRMTPQAKFNSYEALEFLRTYADKTRLPFQFDFRSEGVPLEGPRDYATGTNRPLFRPPAERPQYATTITFTGGTADVYLSAKTKRTGYPRVQILNNGQPQFLLGEIYLRDELPLPDEIVVDIKAAGKPEEGDYPFATNRQSLQDEAKAAVMDYVKSRLAGDVANAENDLYKSAITTAPRIKGSKFTVVNTSGYDDATVARIVEGDFNPGNPGPANWTQPAVPPSPERGRALHKTLMRQLEAGFKEVQAVLVAQNPVYQNAIFTGWGLGKRYYAVNVKTENFLGRGSPRHVMLNPHALHRRAEERAEAALRLAGSDRYSVTDEQFRGLVAEKLASHMAGDLIHELTHNEAWGHDDEYASVLTFNAGESAATLVPIMRRLKRLLLENDGELLRQIERERDALDSSGATRDEDLFAKIGSAQRAADEADAARAAGPGGDGSPGAPGRLGGAGPGGDIGAGRPGPAGDAAAGPGRPGPGLGRAGGAQRGAVDAGPGRGAGDRGPGAGAFDAGRDIGPPGGVRGPGRGRGGPVRGPGGDEAGGVDAGPGVEPGGPVRSIVAHSGAGPGGPGSLAPAAPQRRPGQPGRGAGPLGPSVLPGGGSPTARPGGAPPAGGTGGPGAPGGAGGAGAQPPGGAAPGGAGGQPGAPAAPRPPAPPRGSTGS